MGGGDARSTGKTHTMTGDVKHKDGQGIIPRAIHEIFQYLESRNAEYSVKASYLELYNEVGDTSPRVLARRWLIPRPPSQNLQDLFVPIEDKKQLRVVEDTKRGITCQVRGDDPCTRRVANRWLTALSALPLHSAEP